MKVFVLFILVVVVVTDGVPQTKPEQNLEPAFRITRDRTPLNLKENQLEQTNNKTQLRISVEFDDGNMPAACDLFLDLPSKNGVSVTKITVTDLNASGRNEKSRIPSVSSVAGSPCNGYCDGNLRYCILDLKSTNRYQVTVYFSGKVGLVGDDRVAAWGRFLQSGVQDEQQRKSNLLSSTASDLNNSR